MAKPLAVLIVEDSESDAQIIVRMLTKAGYSLTYEMVETAEQMSYALKKQAWEVVISDFSMPELDGNAALKILQESGLDIPFIVVSGTMGEDTAVAMMKAGAHDYLMKGKLARLVPAVEREIQQAEERRERKKAEESLHGSQKRFSTIFHANPAATALTRMSDNQLIEVSKAWLEISGYTRSEAIGHTGTELNLWAEPDIRAEMVETLQQQGRARCETKIVSKSGEIHDILMSAEIIELAGERYMLTMAQDITKLKQAERFNQAFINNNPMSIQVLDKEGFTLETNPAFRLLFGSVPPLGYSIFNDLQLVQKGMGATFDKLRNGEVIHLPDVKFNPHDSISELPDVPVWVRTIGFPIFDNNNMPIRFILMHEDITTRKQAEEALQSSKQILEGIINAIPVRVFWKDKNLVYLGCNEIFTRDAGFSEPKDIIGKDDFQMGWRDQAEMYRKDDRQVIEGGASKLLLEEPQTTPDGNTITLLTSKVPLRSPIGEITGLIGTYLDITERKQTEQALRDSGERFRALIENSSDAITLLNADGKTIYDSPAAPGMLGYGPEDWIGKNVFELLHPDDSTRILELYQSLVRIPENRISSVFRVRHKNGSWIWLEMVATNLLSKASVKAIVLNYRDISGSIHDEQRIQKQLEHLTSLSAIDRVISTNFDLNVSLSEILTHVTKELEVDAADILLLDPISDMLEFAAKRGFNSKSVKKTQLRLGESYAGRAALERKLVHISNLKAESDTVLLTAIAADDNFVTYYGVPLINKGKVRGVLEVFHREPLEPDAEWFEFLNSFAGQAAIAIENSSLYDSQQRTYQELTLAYDATIEGWSHALDLRDKETEGHTQRVSETTLKLARAFGLTDEELIQVRWGTLLHDIGKMGVPDEILHKPGPLTDEEWVVMKKHPVFAYEMLSPIQYLRRALDIPYCHHEKWDGTGYPQGLKGRQIPLTARIFAVVDVWDALRSDRPYRLAWPDDKVYEHIRSLSGTHFDPQVVEAFLKLPR